MQSADFGVGLEFKMATCSGVPVEDFSRCMRVFAAIGGVTVAYLGLKALYSIFNFLSTYVFSSIPDLKKYGSWAVVTGATDGIGKAYAQELVRKGMNIVLISRTQEKLQDVAAELETMNSGIKTKIIVADFTKGWELKETIKAGLQGLDIGVLVNNVGMSYSYPEFFLELAHAEQFTRDMLMMNITSVLMMTQLCLPMMVDKKKGLVINISSASGFRPTPLLTLYSASKAYVDYFSQAMNQEYASKGITFQSIMPYFVATKLSKIRRPTLLAPSASDFVRSAIRTVSRTCRTTGYAPHHIQAGVMRCLPDWLLDRYVMKMFLTNRHKALKRLQEKKAE